MPAILFAQFNPGLRADRWIDHDNAGEITHDLRHAALDPPGGAMPKYRDAMLTTTGSNRSATTSSVPHAASICCPTSLGNNRPDRLDVGCREDNVLEQSPFFGCRDDNALEQPPFCRRAGLFGQSTVMRNEPQGIPGAMKSPSVKSSKRSSTSRTSAALVSTREPYGRVPTAGRAEARQTRA